MDQLHYLNKTNKIKDISKGHKIAGALYLVTNHLSDNDPFKTALRTHAVTMSTIQNSTLSSTAQTINHLLDMAVIAHLISEKNASIISLELRHYVAMMSDDNDAISSLFTVSETNDMSYSSHQKMSFNTRPIKINNPSNILISNETKSKRQDTILSFINERTSVGIKDIAALFSDTSEKTIQRELGTLVSAGKITKRGEKRWSVYMKL